MFPCPLPGACGGMFPEVNPRAEPVVFILAHLPFRDTHPTSDQVAGESAVAAVVSHHRSGRGVDMGNSPTANAAPETQRDESAGIAVQESSGKKSGCATQLPTPG